MSLCLPPEGPESSSRSILHWRAGVTSQTTALEKAQKAPVIAESVENFLETYSKVLADLSTRRDPHDPILCSLRSGRDYLVLWADDNGVRDGNLDNIIDWSRRLHMLTVRLLIKVGDILTQRLLPRTLDASQQLAPEDRHKITVCLEHLKLLSQGSSNHDSDNDTDESISDAEAEEESLAQVSQSLKVTVGCLVGIGPRLKDRTVERVEELLSKPIETPQWHASVPLIERIRRRYPDCDVDLATRLGEANWRRMEERKRRIEENEQFQESQFALDFGPNAPEKTILAPTTLRDSGIGTSIPSAPSERAETVVSYNGAAGGSIRVPPLPKEARSCEGCGDMIQMSSMVKWKKHLFEDLQPYMCLYDNCRSNFLPFQTKDEWLNHFVVNHARDGEHFECPLCKSSEPVSTMSTLKHVSRHLEEIALTALPIECEPEDDLREGVSQDSPQLEVSSDSRSLWSDGSMEAISSSVNYDDDDARREPRERDAIARPGPGSGGQSFAGTPLPDRWDPLWGLPPQQQQQQQQWRVQPPYPSSPEVVLLDDDGDVIGVARERDAVTRPGSGSGGQSFAGPPPPPDVSTDPIWGYSQQQQQQQWRVPESYPSSPEVVSMD